MTTWMSGAFSRALCGSCVCLLMCAPFADAQEGQWRRAGSTTRGGYTSSRQESPAPAEAPQEQQTPADTEGTPELFDGASDYWQEDAGYYPAYPPELVCLGNMYASFDMLFWWRSGQNVPALVTTSPSGTAQADAGVLGRSTTSILFGGAELNDDNRIGGRVTVGKWLDPYQVNGVVARFYALGDNHVHSQFSSDDYAILGRPFFNVSIAAQDARLTAFPGVSTGTIAVDTRSDITAGDVYFRLLLTRGACWRLDAIGGYQLARIDESLRVHDQLTSIDPGGSVPVGTVIDTDDYFATRNEYNAGVVGAILEYDRGCVALSMTAKVGLGNMREQVTIAGSTVTAVPGGPTTSVASGLLTQPSNIGTFVQNEFSAVPEFDIQARWYLNDRIALTAGYTFVYWSKVARPGDHIDSTLNLTQVPGPIVGESRPAFNFNSSDLFVHGLHVGLRAEW